MLGAMAHDSRLKKWGVVAFWSIGILIIVLPWPLIAWERAQRSASAPAVLVEVWPQRSGNFTVGEFSFTVDDEVYRDEDAGPTLTRGERDWTSDELEGMHVCYDPERPGEDFALAPPQYRCGDPNILTSDGGW